MRRTLALLEPRERRKLAFVLCGVLAGAILEVAGIASILPFLALIGNPDLIRDNAILHRLYTALGFQNVHRFLVFVGAGVLGILIVGNAATALSHWAVMRFASMRAYTLSRRLLSAYLHRPYEFFLTRNTSTMARNILGEVQQLVQGILMPFLHLVSRGLIVLLVSALLIAANPITALVIMGGLGSIYALMYVAIRRRVARLGRERLEANQHRFRFAAEAFGGLKTVKLLGLEDHFVRRFAEPSFRYADRTSRGAAIGMIPRYALETLAFGAILVVTLYLLASGSSLGQMLPLLGLYAFGGYRLLPSLQALFASASELRFAAATLEAVEQDLREGQRLAAARAARDRQPRTLSLRGELELRHVGYAYPQAEGPAVRDVCLTVKAGSSVALVGRTGSGKTTLADLILGLLRPSEGAILVDGVELTEETTRDWQRSLGSIPQDIYLYDETVVRNIALGVPDAQIDRAAVERAARAAQIHEFIVNELPHGYETKVGERGLRLSGGEKQRIGIARALYPNPSLLVLDEATSALDRATEETLLATLRGAASGRTTLVIAHRMSTVRACDVIFLVEDGRIAARGTFEELARTSAAFRELAHEGREGDAGRSGRAVS